MRRAFLASLLAMVAAASVPTALRAGDTPEATVAALSDALLGAMRLDGPSAFEQRRERLEPVLRERFDLGFIAGAVLGRHAADLDDEARAAFDATFGRLVVNTYAARFKGFAGHTIELTETREMRAGRRLVRTVLAKPGDKGVTLDYLLQNTDGAWRIVNVISAGVSDLSLRRAEYGAIIGREGIDELVRRLDAQAAALEKR